MGVERGMYPVEDYIAYGRFPHLRGQALRTLRLRMYFHGQPSCPHSPSLCSLISLYQSCKSLSRSSIHGYY